MCEDGKYRWMYELNLITNPTMFITTFKVFFYIALVTFLIVGFFPNVFSGNWEKMGEMAVTYLIVLGVLTGLTIIGILGLAIMYKGKYIVLFAMDENGIAHVQAPEQFKKAVKLAKATSIAGMVGGSFTTAGAGLLMASRNAFYSDYNDVRRIKPRRWLHLIRVNNRLQRNQIYVPSEDFDFVYNYIKTRCPNAKSRELKQQ